MIDTANNAALTGLSTAQNDLTRNAVQVANFGKGSNQTDLAGPIVGITLDSIQFKANLTVLKTDTENQKALLDILA